MRAAVERFARVLPEPVFERHFAPLRLVDILDFWLGRQAEIARRVRDVPSIAREFEVGIRLLNALDLRYDSADDVVDYPLLLEVERERTLARGDEPGRRHIVGEFFVAVNHDVVFLNVVDLLGRVFFRIVEHSLARAEFGIAPEELHSLCGGFFFHSVLVHHMRIAHLAGVCEQVAVGVRRPAHSEKVAVVRKLVVRSFRRGGLRRNRRIRVRRCRCCRHGFARARGDC